MHGAELQTLEPLTMMAMGMLEAFERTREESRVEMSVKEARETLWIALAEGALTATAIDAKGAVVQIPSHEWPYLKLEADGKFMDRLVFDNGLHERAYDKVTVRHGDVNSLWKGYPEPPALPMMSWLVDEVSWTFLDAATWVGSRGRDLPSEQIVEENLEERGAYALIKALYPPRGLVATGLNDKRLREPIPAES